MTKFAMPRREFVSGSVHYAGPFTKNGVRLTLCGVTGMDKEQSRVRKPLTCSACGLLADWVWQHRKGYGYGETRSPKAQSGD